MRRLLVFALVGLMRTAVAFSAGTLSQSDVIDIVLRENSPIRAARANWDAMKKRVPQARAWEDPMTGIDVQRFGTTSFTNFSAVEWMISQQIPLSGKNLSRGRAASAEAAQAFEQLRRVELEAISQARVAYFRLSTAYAQLAITRQNQELLGQFAEISRVKYEAGTQSQSDVLLAQTDLARLSQTSAEFEREITIQQSALNVLMNRPAQNALAEPVPLTFRPFTLSAETVRTRALARRPEIGRARNAVEAENARLQLARRQWIPDPQVRMAARNLQDRSGVQEYDTGIFFSVPWVNFRKYSAGVDEARSNIKRAERELDFARVETLGLVRDALKRIEIAARNYELFSGKIVPLARQSIESTRAGYEADRTGFLELITARRNFQDAQSAAATELSLHEVGIAELEAIIGGDGRSSGAEVRNTIGK